MQELLLKSSLFKFINFPLKPRNTIAGVYKQDILLAPPLPHEEQHSIIQYEYPVHHFSNTATVLSQVG
jgi:hypothetical protein